MSAAPKRKPQPTKRRIREQAPSYGVEEMQRAMHILALMQGSSLQEQPTRRTRQADAVDKKKAGPLLAYQNLRASAAAAGISVVDGQGRPLKKAAIQQALDAKNGTKVLAPVITPTEPPKVEAPKVETPKVAESVKVTEITKT